MRLPRRKDQFLATRFKWRRFTAHMNPMLYASWQLNIPHTIHLWHEFGTAVGYRRAAAFVRRVYIGPYREATRWWLMADSLPAKARLETLEAIIRTRPE